MATEVLPRFVELLLQTNLYQWVGAFVILAITDICWAKYTVATAQTNDPLPAAAWAVCLFMLGGMAVVGYTTNPVLLIPSAAGAFFGTYIGVKTVKKEKK